MGTNVDAMYAVVTAMGTLEAVDRGDLVEAVARAAVDGKGLQDLLLGVTGVLAGSEDQAVRDIFDEFRTLAGF